MNPSTQPVAPRLIHGLTLRVLDAVETLASDFGTFNQASAVVRSNCIRVLATGRIGWKRRRKGTDEGPKNTPVLLNNAYAKNYTGTRQ